MNRAELIASVHESLGDTASRADAERAVTAVIGGIKTALRRGRGVQLVGFGTFKVADRKSRMGVNPRTLDPISIDAQRSVRFLPGKDLKMKSISPS